MDCIENGKLPGHMTRKDSIACGAVLATILVTIACGAVVIGIGPDSSARIAQASQEAPHE